MGQKDFDEKGAKLELMVWMENFIWGIGKVLIVDIGFCILEGLILMVEKVLLGLPLINK